MAGKSAYLPADWDDDTKMNALFSHFRPRNVNPIDYETKLSFWMDVLVNWLHAQEHGCTFVYSDVESAFTKNGCVPLGLGVVVSEAVRNEHIALVSDYERSVSKRGWLDWSLEIFVKKPLAYTWSLVNGGSIGDVSWPKDSRFVNILKVKEKSKEVIRRLKALVANEGDVLGFEELFRTCRDYCKADSDLDLVLLWLQNQGDIFVHTESGRKVVRFCNNNIEKVTSLSQAEIASVHLRSAKHTLENQIETYLSSLDSCVTEARSHLRNGSKNSAKAALQRKKQIEKLLLQKEKTLENIELLLERLRDIGIQKKILNAFDIGTKAFKNQIDLNRIEETMSAVTESLELQEEMQDALQGSIRDDDAELSLLEEELDSLMSLEESHRSLKVTEKFLEGSTDSKFLDDVLPSPPENDLEKVASGRFLVQNLQEQAQ